MCLSEVTIKIQSTGLETSYSYDGAFIDVKGIYSWSYADYIFEELNDGLPFPYEYDIPHTISLAGRIQLKPKWHLSLDWYFASGKTFTLYDSYFNYSPLDRGVEEEVIPLSGYNDNRLPNQHKLSCSISTYWNYKTLRNDLIFGIQNIYNRRNAIYQYSIDESIQSFNGMPILPIIRWKISY